MISWHRFAFAALLMVLGVRNAAGSEVPVRRIEVGGATVEFPNDPEFVVLSLDVVPVRGRVRVFGDGSVSLFKHLGHTGWKEYELQMKAWEFEELVRKIVTGGVLDYDPEAVSAKLRKSDQPVPMNSSPTTATLKMWLTQYERSSGVVNQDFAHSARLNDVSSVSRHEEYYKEAPEVLALSWVVRKLLNLESRPGLRLIVAVPPDPSSQPSWASSSTVAGRTPRILFFKARRKGVWSIDWLGSDRRQLLAETDLGVDFPQPPSVSPDLRLIAWRGAGGLHVTDLETGNTRKLLEVSPHSHSAVWSPNGDRVAASATVGTQQFHLVVANSDGSNPQVMSNTSAKPIQWTAEGEQLYFQASSQSEPIPKTYIINRDGTNQQPVMPQPIAAFRVSPDGRLVAFVASLESLDGDPKSGLFTIRLQRDTGTVAEQAVPVWVAPEAFGYDWSPDSKYLVIATSLKLTVVSAQGGDSRTLVDLEIGVGGAVHPNWSPDGRAIVFVKVAGGGDRGSETEIWIIGQDGSEPRHIADGYFPHWYTELTPPVWLPY